MQVRFVNREAELTALDKWWTRGRGMALVWGRRRVGKTWLIEHFAKDIPSVIHTGGSRAPAREVELFSAAVERAGLSGTRDLARRPFASWDEALDHLAGNVRAPLLVVLDEFQEIVAGAPEIETVLRAFGERAGPRSRVRILVAGSAVRTMQRLAAERAPLYGRFDLQLPVHPFAPHEAALMLPEIDPPTRALVWGILGGVPLYLSWWDQGSCVEDNLRELVCSPAGRLLSEGHLVLATEGDDLRQAGPILSAVAGGRTRFSEIADAVRTDPTRPVERLIELRLLERVVPVTEDPRKSRRAHYRVADNFLAFWLSIVDRHRAEIERGLGESILPVVLASLDDFMGSRWEEAFRAHLRRRAAAGDLGSEVVAVGPYWDGGVEMDALVLAGRSRRPRLVGEAKWAREIDAPRVEAALLRKAAVLEDVDDDLRVAVCAREEVRGAAPSTLVVTAADIFE